ncbi:MAG: hypothetical protein H7125_01820 [Proteobacteria bacterium]|nr:hypothetical protein [Burkholderiales bacterium]
MRAAQLRLRLSLAAFAASLIGTAPVAAQPVPACGAGLASAQRTESARHVIVWRADPQRIPVGRHFALDLIACPKPGASAIDGLGVDARMPAHGHGMNYKPSVKALGENRYRAEGLMFHMPGQWELAFELRSGEQNERALQALTVR